MDFYSKSGHQASIEKMTDNYASIESFKEIESTDPNSTIDAKRMVKTVIDLLHQEIKGRFLDVGCGYGFFSKEAIGNGFNVTPLELAQTERVIAGELLGISPIESSFEDFDHSPSSFSVVLMSQILEHALDVNQWIKKAHYLLEPDGIIAIALPNFGSLFRIFLQENEPYISPPAHLNFFNPSSLSQVLTKHGFQVESIQWVSRIPKRTFEKRLPSILTPLLPVINGLAQITLKGIDVLHLGMMINIYARKVV
jgi:2-polyprenyl-3-methyl-5-hydroxy-6-metoxy-1,4-benzoquinol methylase